MSVFRVMVVDDHESLRTIARLALSQKYEVVEAHDGLDALEKLDRAEPDFMILDVKMPLMDGYEVCRVVRQHPKFCDMPVLFLSALDQHEAVKKGYEAGASFYLTKPVDPQHIVNTVEYYLEDSQATPRAKQFTLEQLKEMDAEKAEPETAAAQTETAPAPAAVPQEPLPAAESEAPPTPRVLIIDNRPESIKPLEAALGDEFQAIAAKGGADAIEKIILFHPDLVVLEANLPGMSGYELCTSIRRNSYYGSMPIIFKSTKASKHEQRLAEQAGADDFMPRGFKPEDLRQKLLEFTQDPGFVVRQKKITVDISFPGGSVEPEDEDENENEEI